MMIEVIDIRYDLYLEISGWSDDYIIRWFALNIVQEHTHLSRTAWELYQPLFIVLNLPTSSAVDLPIGLHDQNTEYFSPDDRLIETSTWTTTRYRIWHMLVLGG